MIDINELCRLLNSKDMIDGIDLHANIKPIIKEILDRLEAAEEERDKYKLAYNEWIAKTEWLRHEIARSSLPAKYLGMHRADAIKLEIDRLRAKVEAMERQEPVAWMLNCQTLGGDTGWILSWTQSGAGLCNRLSGEENEKKLYALPGAQNVPSEQDESVRKSWARFSNELHRSPDAPYPGMSEAFEQHFSQSFTDREWRLESGVWAAAWKAAKRHGAQLAPSVPDGWKLVPIEPTQEMINHVIDERFEALVAGKDHTFINIYKAMLAAAPEAKP